MKFLLRLIICFLLIIVFPFDSLSAEILQINSSKNIIVGDQNRNLSIELFCAEVKKEDEEKAIKILKSNFPRGKRVRIKPIRYDDGQLVAQVFSISENVGMTDLLIAKDLSQNNCE